MTSTQWPKRPRRPHVRQLNFKTYLINHVIFSVCRNGVSSGEIITHLWRSQGLLEAPLDWHRLAAHRNKFFIRWPILLLSPDSVCKTQHRRLNQLSNSLSYFFRRCRNFTIVTCRSSPFEFMSLFLAMSLVRNLPPHGLTLERFFCYIAMCRNQRICTLFLRTRMFLRHIISTKFGCWTCSNNTTTTLHLISNKKPLQLKLSRVKISLLQDTYIGNNGLFIWWKPIHIGTKVKPI